MNYLNLNEDKLSNVVIEMNQLLADYHLYYQNLRNFHWNIVGENFFELHNKFEELYNEARIKIDAIAERILTLRFHPLSNYSAYLKLSNIDEASRELTDRKMVETLLNNHKILIVQLNKVIETAEEANVYPPKTVMKTVQIDNDADSKYDETIKFSYITNDRTDFTLITDRDDILIAIEDGENLTVLENQKIFKANQQNKTSYIYTDDNGKRVEFRTEEGLNTSK